MVNNTAKIIVDGDDKVTRTIQKIIEQTFKEGEFEVEVTTTRKNRSVEHIFKRCNKSKNLSKRAPKKILSLGSHLDVLALDYRTHTDLGTVGAIGIDVPWELLRKDVRNFNKYYEAFTTCDTIITVGLPKGLFGDETIVKVGM